MTRNGILLATLVCLAGGLTGSARLSAQPPAPLARLPGGDPLFNPVAPDAPAVAAPPAAPPGGAPVTPPAGGSAGSGKEPTPAGPTPPSQEGNKPTVHVYPWYVGVSGAWQERGSAADTVNPGTFLNLEDGYAVNAAFGRRWRLLRLEAEFSFMDNQIRHAGLAGTDGPIASGAADGHMNLTAYMFNVYYEIPIKDCRLKPYVGVGFGAYHGEISGFAPHFAPPLVIGDTSSDYQFAYQFRLGLGYELTERTEVYSGYRFFHGDQLLFPGGGTVPDFHPRRAELHNLEVGLRWKF